MQRVCDIRYYVVIFKRLGNIVKRTKLNGFNRIFNLSIPGEHYNVQFLINRLDLL